MPDPWTFQTLAAADRKTLEGVLDGASAPDPEQLDGRLYRGWNHEWFSVLTGRKFRKGFRRHPQLGGLIGFNERIDQDGEGPDGEWRVLLHDDGAPKRLGYYRVNRFDETPIDPWALRYPAAGLLDYGIGLNRGIQLPLRVIRDVIALPNPGDHDLLLGKAYLRFGFNRMSFFYCYFLLGHPEPIEHEPW